MTQSTIIRNLSRYRHFLLLGAGLFLLALGPAVTAVLAAEITVPRIEMDSRGGFDDGEFSVSSRISADLALTGGYKYSFLLGFTLETADIARAFAYRNVQINTLPAGGSVSTEEYNTLADQLNNQAVLGFRIAKATVRDLFSLPLELSYFIGSDDDFCTGDEFVSRYGLTPFGTDFRGFFYFPDGIGSNPLRSYNGIYTVQGAGISLGLTKWTNFTPMLYLYQDFGSPTDILDGNNEKLYSGDLRFLFNRDRLKLEAFGGISLNPGLDTNYRGGLMTYFSGGEGAELFAQGGITSWTPDEKLSVDNFYFLIEPRLHMGFFGIYVTFFYHPLEYNHIISSEEQGKANINLKFLFENTNSGLTGGIETGADLKTDDFKTAGSERVVLRIAPFGTFISGGLQWDAKLQIKPLNKGEPKEMFEIIIGVRTAY